MSKFKNMWALYRSSYVASQVIFMLALIFILSGCKKNDEPDYSELLKGVWINTHTDETAVQTNDKFVLEFTGVAEKYSAGVIFDTLNKKWIDSRSFDYSISGDRINISGTDVQNNALELEFGIISISNSQLIYRVNLFKINGVDLPDNKIYKFKKVSKNLNENITGTWYGKATYAGSTDTDYHYWNYLPDGTYEYYYRENPSSQQWIKKTDNEGRYYLYDNLLATNWSNDIFSGNPGLDYECWEIDITGNVMKWNGYRADGLVAIYEMEKVSGPPVVF